MSVQEVAENKKSETKNNGDGTYYLYVPRKLFDANLKIYQLFLTFQYQDAILKTPQFEVICLVPVPEPTEPEKKETQQDHVFMFEIPPPKNDSAKIGELEVVQATGPKESRLLYSFPIRIQDKLTEDDAKTSITVIEFDVQNVTSDQLHTLKIAKHANAGLSFYRLSDRSDGYVFTCRSLIVQSTAPVPVFS